jgi:methylthioribose-1-phosphate isomerase
MTDAGEILDAPPSSRPAPYGKLRLIDQTLLPLEERYVETDDPEEIYDYIKRLVVRGAPAIGCAAALGLAAVMCRSNAGSVGEFVEGVRSVASRLAESRPTAVNLFWALDRCVAVVDGADGVSLVEELKDVLIVEALTILSEDISMCRAIGENGLPLLSDGATVLTHCNAGGLATSGFGTALAPIYAASERGVAVGVYSDETRPLLQGSRLTAWELKRAGIEVVTICDNMAAQVMREGKVDIVIVGADRIAANGDVANKIGTYGLAVLAKHHGVPFHVAAPVSTIDFSLPDGGGIPIELRDGDEVRRGFGRLTAPEGVEVYNPAFDVTPADLITSLITDRGIKSPPFVDSLSELRRDLVDGKAAKGC